MSDDREQVSGPTEESEVEPRDPLWGNLWQVPAIVASLVLIVAGLYVASRRAPEQDFDGVLEQIADRISAGDLDGARGQLEQVIKPRLQLATTAQRARYHANVADWVAVSQEASGVNLWSNSRIIVDEYDRAARLGMIMSAARLDRWASALIDLGDVETALERMSELEALSVTDFSGAEARRRRNRLLRRIVEASLEGQDLSAAEVLARLEEYRHDPMLTTADRAWVAVREAKLRLDTGRTGEAIRQLFVDMRRLGDEADVIDGAAWGELYTLLGQGYFDQGRYHHAAFYLDEALDRMRNAEAGRSEALLLYARISFARGDVEDAQIRFDEVVRDYPTTPAHLPALLGRAEMLSILGEHQDSLRDYRDVLARITAAEPRRECSPETVASSLADRHDAALMMGGLDLALEYVALAESLFASGNVPTDVLRRIASTSRQIADNVMAEAGRGDEEAEPWPFELIDPALRRSAIEKYRRAGDYFLRHARRVAGAASDDDSWADSLWLSGDSYDLAGSRSRAIEYFLEYVAGRPIDDPRRAEVLFRIAQSYEAEEKYESAADYYLRVIEERPRSTFGTGSHVPLARCHLVLGRPGDAERELVQVVDGRLGVESLLTPEAVDYRNALIELGKLYYDQGQAKSAIERLTVALERYPNDPRANEVRFRLADSYRRHALATRADLWARPRMSPADRIRGERAVQEDLETSLVIFSGVIEDYAARPERDLDPIQLDYQRFAMLYRADCGYELGRYAAAAEMYDQAARKYSSHHSSMHALVQIVNCYDRLGETRDADIAHHNALIRLRQLPDRVFRDPQSMMDRAAWERWLRDRPVGATAAAARTG